MDTRLILSLLLPVVCSQVASAQSNIDPDHKNAWCENVGWTNWRDAKESEQGVAVETTFLAGFIWVENLGWINVGDGSPDNGIHYANENGSDFGVNIDPETGDLFGLAWAENVGWINFDTRDKGDDRARFGGCEHRFFGFAWSENIGWINLDDAEHYVGVGPCEYGDFDCDNDVDLTDYEAFQEAMAGPEVAADCSTFDADDDGDIDSVDFLAFQLVFTGS